MPREVKSVLLELQPDGTTREVRIQYRLELPDPEDNSSVLRSRKVCAIPWDALSNEQQEKVTALVANVSGFVDTGISYAKAEATRLEQERVAVEEQRRIEKTRMEQQRAAAKELAEEQERLRAVDEKRLREESSPPLPTLADQQPGEAKEEEVRTREP